MKTEEQIIEQEIKRVYNQTSVIVTLSDSEKSVVLGCMKESGIQAVTEYRKIQIPDNATLDLMKRVNDAERKADRSSNHLHEYMMLLEDIIGFAGPAEMVREALMNLKNGLSSAKTKA